MNNEINDLLVGAEYILSTGKGDYACRERTAYLIGGLGDIGREIPLRNFREFYSRIHLVIPLVEDNEQLLLDAEHHLENAKIDYLHTLYLHKSLLELTGDGHKS